MNVDCSLILACRDQEAALPDMVRSMLVVAQSIAHPGQEAGAASFEILALDERSRDNSLSVLAMLQTQIAQLAIYDAVRPGEAIKSGVARARGRILVIADRRVRISHGRWAAETVLGAHHAALVPEEVLAVRRDLAERSLLNLRGGLVGAQRAVTAEMLAEGQRPAYAPANAEGIKDRTRRWLRGRASAWSVTARTFDRPADDAR